jgi:hypothetical protein
VVFVFVLAFGAAMSGSSSAVGRTKDVFSLFFFGGGYFSLLAKRKEKI